MVGVLQRGTYIYDSIDRRYQRKERLITGRYFLMKVNDEYLIDFSPIVSMLNGVAADSVTNSTVPLTGKRLSDLFMHNLTSLYYITIHTNYSPNWGNFNISTDPIIIIAICISIADNINIILLIQQHMKVSARSTIILFSFFNCFNKYQLLEREGDSNATTYNCQSHTAQK